MVDSRHKMPHCMVRVCVCVAVRVCVVVCMHVAVWVRVWLRVCVLVCGGVGEWSRLMASLWVDVQVRNMAAVPLCVDGRVVAVIEAVNVPDVAVLGEPTYVLWIGHAYRVC